MKFSSKRGYLLTVFVAIILAFVMGMVFDNHYVESRSFNHVELWEQEPDEILDGDYYTRFVLPENAREGSYVCFLTSHFEAEVSIDGELVFSIKASNPKLNKSTGYRWNFIKLKKEDAGKEMVIRQIPVYKGLTPVTEMYYGEKYDIIMNIVDENIVRFVFSCIILVVGIVLMIYSLFIVETNKRDEALIHFSVFAVMLAIWSIMESPIFELLQRMPVYKLVIDHYTLMIMPMAFNMFMHKQFHIKDNRIWNAFTYLNVFVITARTILQVLAIADLKETLWMTQTIIALFVILGIGWGYLNLKNGHLSKLMKVNLFWISCLLLATIIELVVFVVFDKNNSLGMFGFACYVLVMAIEMVRKSRKQVRRAQEAELYKKLAFTDELTGTYNRTAFSRDMENQWVINKKTQECTIKPTTMFMFDLNDLKKCNDQFGHEYGDQYIKMIADVILHVIGVDGRCYRIGGDEFCAIVPFVNQKEIDNKLISIVREVTELDKKGFVVPVSVAVGYATFNSEYDECLEDTMKRADVLMYQNKQMIKKNREKNKEEQGLKDKSSKEKKNK